MFYFKGYVCFVTFLETVVKLFEYKLINVMYSRTSCPEERCSLLLPLTLPNDNRFPKFFHRQA